MRGDQQAKGPAGDKLKDSQPRQRRMFSDLQVIRNSLLWLMEEKQKIIQMRDLDKIAIIINLYK